MSSILDKSFNEMSLSFQRALGYSSAGNYMQSIPLYEMAIKENKNDFAALNNIAVSKIHIGIELKDKKLIQEATEHLSKAIRITEEVFNYEDGYPFAEENLAWAKYELEKLG